MRLLSVALPDHMDRLQCSSVRSSVKDHHDRGVGAPTSARRHASPGTSRNDLALVGASELTCFCVGGRDSIDFIVEDRN